MDNPKPNGPTLSVAELVDRIMEVRSQIGLCSVDVWGVGNGQLRCADFTFSNVSMSAPCIKFEFDRQVSLLVSDPTLCSFAQNQLTIGLASQVGWQMRGIGGFQSFSFGTERGLVRFSMNPRVHVHVFPDPGKPAVQIRWMPSYPKP
jgi:hypothetical protein